MVGGTDLKLPFAKLTGFDVELSNLFLHYIRLHKRSMLSFPAWQASDIDDSLWALTPDPDAQGFSFTEVFRISIK